MGVKTFYDWKPLATHTGPGDYDPMKPNLAHSYTMNGRQRDAWNERAPGPGSYNAEDYFRKMKGAGLDKNKWDTTVDLKYVYSPGPAQEV